MKNNINWHSVRTVGLIVVAFIVAGLQSIHGMTPFDSIIDGIIPILLAVEHYAAGNSSLS